MENKQAFLLFPLNVHTNTPLAKQLNKEHWLNRDKTATLHSRLSQHNLSHSWKIITMR